MVIVLIQPFQLYYRPTIPRDSVRIYVTNDTTF